jgi:hypothetical protein
MNELMYEGWDFSALAPRPTVVYCALCPELGRSSAGYVQLSRLLTPTTEADCGFQNYFLNKNRTMDDGDFPSVTSRPGAYGTILCFLNYIFSDPELKYLRTPAPIIVFCINNNTVHFQLETRMTMEHRNAI